MTDTIPSEIAKRVSQSLGKRHRAETCLILLGKIAVYGSLLVLASLLTFVSVIGTSTIKKTVIDIPVYVDASVIDPTGERDPVLLARANYQALITKALHSKFPDVKKRRDRRALKKILSIGAEYELKELVLANPELIGKISAYTFTASSDVDIWLKSAKDNSSKLLKIKQIEWVERFAAEGTLRQVFNNSFLTNGDSREPELAGIWGAMIGSILTLAVCIGLSFPIGVMAAIYLEELAPKNKLTRAIEVNISNLAAVPSIIFGILGLALFLNFFGVPRSAPLVGGMVLALMTMPTIVITARASIQAVPPSIREAALGLGASEIQTIFHHVIPLAMPGILTGSIIGMARALGETAPLLIVGMAAFIADAPTNVTEPATVLPVQIYLWADSPERGFVEKTGAAIMVLLVFLITMNSVAIYLRNKFETKW
ncbi:MAG: phosphate ABC transporter permease PstA [Sneathiella sp.]